MFVLIKEAQFDFPSPYWDEISPAAKDLVSHLLQKDPKTRFSSEQVLDHEWMKGGVASEKENQQMIDTLREFNARRKFQQGVGKIIMVNRFADPIRQKSSVMSTSSDKGGN